MGDRERLPGARDAEEDLVLQTVPEPLDEPGDRGTLVAGGLEVAVQPEGPGTRCDGWVSSMDGPRGRQEVRFDG